jgi:hypothetical protein
MLTQRTTIISQLERHGWQAGLLDETEYCWKSSAWQIDELWLLESVWSPEGRQLYLAFLIDPQVDLQKRKKGEGVWAVRASTELSLFWLSDTCLSLGSGWEKGLPAFLQEIAALRWKNEISGEIAWSELSERHRSVVGSSPAAIIRTAGAEKQSEERCQIIFLI